MRKFLILALTVVLATGMIGSAFAYFSDVETSSGNTFTAGTWDDLTYNINYTYIGDGTVTVGGAGAGNDSNGIDSQVVFDNVAPGDSGTITWILTNTGNLPGKLNVQARRINDYDGINTEPEMEIEGPSITATTDGELNDNIMLTTIYYLNGVQYGPSFTGDMGAVRFNPTYTTIDSLPVNLPAYPNGVYTIVWNWNIPSSAGNDIQGDTFQIDLEMTLDQIP